MSLISIRESKVLLMCLTFFLVGYSSSTLAVNGKWTHTPTLVPSPRYAENYHTHYRYSSKDAAAKDYCSVYEQVFDLWRVKEPLQFLSINAQNISERWWVVCEVKMEADLNWTPAGGTVLEKLDPCVDQWNDIASSQCGTDPRNNGEQCQLTNKPVNILTGNKYYSQLDYQGRGAFPLKLERFYNSFSRHVIWNWSYRQNISILNLNPAVVEVFRPNGEYYKFTDSSGTWITNSDITSTLVTVANGYLLTISDDLVERYDQDGRLVSITNRAGLAHNINYSEGEITITDSSGEILIYEIDSIGRVERAIVSGSVKFRYAYNMNNFLEYISLPDATLAQSGSNPFGEDNPYITLHYEDGNFAQLVTGVTDAEGNRISRVAFDSDGRVATSEIDNGIEQSTFDYTYINDIQDPRITVTNSLEKNTTYHFITINGMRKVTQVEGHPTANCVGANKNYTYDANGFLDTVTDWEGHVTDYDHDSRGLEIKRVEGKGTAQERTILTEWESGYRLPKKITEPERVIDFSYDANGQLLERKETPVGP